MSSDQNSPLLHMFPDAKTAYVLDCETDGLLDQLAVIHGLVLRCAFTGEVVADCANQPGHLPIEDGLRMAMKADLVFGHNLLEFDLPALKKVYPWFTLRDEQAYDTLVLAWLVYPDIKGRDFKYSKKNAAFPKFLIGRQSLEAWGHRLGLHKGDYAKEMKAKGLDPWANWYPEQQEYCVQDTAVTLKLLNKILAQGFSRESWEIEHRFFRIIKLQEKAGFPFNVEKAEKLQHVMLRRKLEIEEELQAVFPPVEIRTPFVPKVNNSKLGYRKGELTYKSRTEVFNPGSRDHIARRLKDRYGWVSPHKTKKDGKPKIDESTLGTLDQPEAALLIEYLMTQKRLGMLAEGKNAWLRLVRDGRIHGRVNTNGAVTGRCTHDKPNVAQTPSVKLDKKTEEPILGSAGGYGYECRELFEALPGWKLVGADASGLELRCLGHFMGIYDGGEYIKTLLEGDVHSVNQLAAGLPTRASAKTFIYAYLYGAGDELIGGILKPKAPSRVKKALGKKIKAEFLAKTPALKSLKEKIEKNFGKRGYLKGLDGRKLWVRHKHAILNTLLQSAGALVMKVATIFLYDELSTCGYVFGKDWMLVAHVHDEVQLLVREEIVEEVKQVAVEAIRKAGQHFKFRCPLDGDAKDGTNWAETH